MSKIYTHENHPHQPRTITREDVHEAHKQRGGLNAAIAILLTRGVATMWCAYLFAALAVVGLLGLFGWLNPFIFLLTTWVSQQFLQLVLLSVIMVGQGLLGRHAEMVSEEGYKTTVKSYHQLGQMVRHLNSQDEELLRQTAELLRQTPMLTEILTLLKAQQPSPREQALEENARLLRQTTELIRQIKALAKIAPPEA